MNDNPLAALCPPYWRAAHQHHFEICGYRSKPNSTVACKLWDVRTAEADLGKILVGQHLVGSQARLIGLVRLIASPKAGN
jgi:hypothetical protein